MTCCASWLVVLGLTLAACCLQVVNLVTNRVSRILGKVENTERFLRVALYQGIPKQGIKTQRQLATTESSRAVTRQPTLLCTAFNKQRLFLFTTQEPDDSDQASSSRCDLPWLSGCCSAHTNHICCCGRVRLAGCSTLRRACRDCPDALIFARFISSNSLPLRVCHAEAISARLAQLSGPCCHCGTVFEAPNVPAEMCLMRSQQQRTCWLRVGQGCQRARAVPYPGQLSFTALGATSTSSYSLTSAPRLWRTGPPTHATATTTVSSFTGSSRASCCRQGTLWVGPCRPAVTCSVTPDPTLTPKAPQATLSTVSLSDHQPQKQA